MSSLNALFAGFCLVLAFLIIDGGVAKQAGAACGGGWVSVGGGCELPDDLSIGDQVEVSIGSAVSQRGAIVGYMACEGRRTYYTSPRQSGCGWRSAITAYARTASSMAVRTEAESFSESR